MPDNERPIADILRQTLLFSRLSETQLARVVHSAVRVHLNEHESLFEQGKPALRFYVVLSGQIKLYRLSSGGAEKIIEIVTPGHSFAEALMFMDYPVYPVSASALQPTSLVSIDARAFKALLAESIDSCFLIMGDMTQRLRSLVQEIDDLTLRSATCRVAGYLVNASHDSGGALVLKLPKQVLASRLSVTPETFSRILRKLSDRGIIEVERDVVRIRDREGLTAEASSCGL